ncbi:hypothetical protein SLEP1_g9602 [Rubroshorea leprosula]|uniref:Transposase n=1 Tax=Rubroshorea leprosula TaxID=152421 RepID=A0AAV5IDW4_9ROSI|nr:hypothetical protein SLEP1_g9602 [Rubroshorea leprosula]
MEYSNIVDVNANLDLSGDERDKKLDNTTKMCLHVGGRRRSDSLPAPGDDQKEDNDNASDNVQPNVTEESVGVDGAIVNVTEEGVGVETHDGDVVSDDGVRAEYDDGEEDHIIDVPELTDNEDEETLQARKNVKFFNNIKDSIEKDLEPPTVDVKYYDAHTIGSSARGPSRQHFDKADEIRSDEENSHLSTSDNKRSEAKHGKRRWATHKVYQEPGDDETRDIRIGMIFINNQQFKDAMNKWNLKQRRDIKWIKNDHIRCKTSCVKLLKKNKQCSSIIASKYLVRHRGFAALYMRQIDIYNVIRRELSVELSHHQLKRVKKKIEKAFEGDCKMEYGMLLVLMVPSLKERSKKYCWLLFLGMQTIRCIHLHRQRWKLRHIKPSAVLAIMNTHPGFWSKAFYKEDSKCDVVDNNMCKVFNDLILEARHKVIFSMLEDLRAMCARRRVARREYGNSKFVGNFGPKIWAKIVAAREVIVINHGQENDEDYVAHWYNKQMFMASHEYEVPVIEGMNQWKETKMPLIQPPNPREMLGRPKKERVLEEWQGKTSVGRKGRLMTCQKCFKRDTTQGHQEQNEDQVTPQEEQPQGVDENIGGNVENPMSQVEDPLSQVLNEAPTPKRFRQTARRKQEVPRKRAEKDHATTTTAPFKSQVVTPSTPKDKGKQPKP